MQRETKVKNSKIIISAQRVLERSILAHQRTKRVSKAAIFDDKRKSAFTLAEILITLAIIGVIAAMTLPTLMQKRTNMEVESKLKKIYSVMNQAILMSELDNGPKEYWPSACSSNSCQAYYNKYFLPYLKNTSYVEFTSYGGYNIAIYFSDGTCLIGKAGYDYFFFPNAKNFDKETFVLVDENQNVTREGLGITYFAFRFSPSANSDTNIFHYKKGFEPYKLELRTINKQTLTTGCNNSSKIYCTALIQYNGWKIPNDYPCLVK